MNSNEKQTAGRGLYYLFLGQILALFALIPLLGAVAVIAGGVLSILGFYTLSRAHEGYKTAFILLLANVVIQLLSSAFSETGFWGTCFSFVGAFLNAMVIYYVCNTTSAMLENQDPAVAALGHKIWKGVILGTIVEMICVVLSLIPLIDVLALIVAFIISILQLIIAILYLVFLWKSQKVLRSSR